MPGKRLRLLPGLPPETRPLIESDAKGRDAERWVQLDPDDWDLRPAAGPAAFLFSVGLRLSRSEVENSRQISRA